MPAEGESRDRLSRALRACGLEASFNEAPPPPPAEAIARLIRTVIDEGHDGDGLAMIWHMSSLHSSRMLMGIALAEIALREDVDITEREIALIASSALWVMREQEDQRSMPGVDSITCIHGIVDESGLESRVRVPLDPAAGWAARLDQAAQDQALADRCRRIAADARSGELRRDSLPATLRSALAPPRSEPEREVQLHTSHATDFTSVTWFGTKYTFNKSQAQAIAVLWAEWEKGGHGLGQESIREAIDSNAEPFRLSHIFRDGKKKPHPAWKTMIATMGKGIYALVPPDSSDSPENHT